MPGTTYLPFGRNVQDVTPEDVRLWLSRWDRGLKTKANYHGLLFGVFAWAVEEHALITVNPCAKTAPSRPTIKAEQPERTWLTEAEFKTFTDTFMAENSRDLLRVMVGTGLRFGEITALWVEDIDLTKRALIVRKAWNRQGEDGETQIPKWLDKRISAKHEMRGHYLGIPKTSKSRRTSPRRSIPPSSRDSPTPTSPTVRPWSCRRSVITSTSKVSCSPSSAETYTGRAPKRRPTPWWHGPVTTTEASGTGSSTPVSGRREKTSRVPAGSARG